MHAQREIYQNGERITAAQAVQVMHNVGGIDPHDMLDIAKRARDGEDEALEELEELTGLEFM